MAASSFAQNRPGNRPQRKDEYCQANRQKANQGRAGVLSIQVLEEFYQISTQKIRIPLSMQDAFEYLHSMSVLETVHPDFNLFVAAVYLHKRLNLPFWDGLIVQAAVAANCSFLLTEDLQDGLRVGDLIVRNSFLAEDFSR